MPKKPDSKDAQKRVKSSGKIGDLPAKAVEGQDADEVKGGVIKVNKVRRN